MNALFNPTVIGRYEARNAIIMAPMSRNRADRTGRVPAITADYYRQRASAGLIVAESTMVNDWAGGMFAPGIYNEVQADAWRKVTDAVHAEGGLIFLQLWHAGRAAHQSLMPSARYVGGPSAIGISREIMTYEGLQPATTPMAYASNDIQELIADYGRAAELAQQAGFDGVEIHASGGYLIDQFLQDGSNQRSDTYGGTLANRYRFLEDVLIAVLKTWDVDQVGVRLSPTSTFNEIHDSDPLAMFSHVIDGLNQFGLAYLHLIVEMPGQAQTDADRTLIDTLRAQWRGTLIANGGFDLTTASEHIARDQANAIAFGRPFIANPDLVERYRLAAPLNALDESTFYGGDQRGYTDYPTLQQLEAPAA